MKTFGLFDIKNTVRILPVILGFLLVSCGSYHNRSYYDNDGVYLNSGRYAQEEVGNEVVEQSGSYFTQFQDYYIPADQEPVGIFTDVDSYYGNGETYSTGYSGWGNSVSSVDVNIYGGSFGWGSPYWSYGWGWNSWYNPYWNYGWNSWYNPHWGYGSWHNPYWSWSSGWGGYYPYYGNYIYNRGPRTTYGSDYGYRSRVMPSNASRITGQNRAYEVRGRNENAAPTRSDSRFTTRNDNRSNSVQSTRSTNTNATRNSSINNNRSTNNSTINSSRNNTINNSRNNTINNSRNNNSSNTINNNRSGSFNSGRSNSPSMNTGRSTGGSRSSGMGGGSSRSSSGGRR